MTRKHYCGTYKGISVWQEGEMIGSSWYGTFFITEERGMSKRRFRVKDSEHSSWDALKEWINKCYLPSKGEEQAAENTKPDTEVDLDGQLNKELRNFIDFDDGRTMLDIAKHFYELGKKAAQEQ